MITRRYKKNWIKNYFANKSQTKINYFIDIGILFNLTTKWNCTLIMGSVYLEEVKMLIWHVLLWTTFMLHNIDLY